MLGLRRRYSVPSVLQMEKTECGAASLSMILKYYGKNISLEQLRDECGIGRNGCSTSKLLKVAKDHGLEPKAYQLTMQELYKLKPPLIIYWNQEHFLVYEGSSSNNQEFYLNDPAIGPRIVGSDEFLLSFSNIAIDFKNSKVKKKSTNNENLILTNLSKIMNLFGGIKFIFILAMLLFCIVPILLSLSVKVIIDNCYENYNWLTITISLCLIIFVLHLLIGFCISNISKNGYIFNFYRGFNKTVEHLRKLPNYFFSQRSVGDLLYKIIGWDKIINISYGKLLINILSICLSVFVLGIMTILNFKLTLCSFILAFINIYFLRYVSNKKILLRQKFIAKQYYLINSIISSMNSFVSIKSMGREHFLFEKWMKNSIELNKHQVKLKSLDFLYNFIPIVISIISSVCILCYGSYLIICSNLTIGTLFSFEILNLLFVSPIVYFAINYSDYQSLLIELKYIDDIMNYPQSNYFNGKNNYDLSKKVKLSLIDVNFSYVKNENTFLHNINLTVNQGELVALVGRSGVGKSTIAKLLTGLVYPFSGDIKINDQSIKNYTTDDYRNIIGHVEQGYKFFDGSLIENLTFGRKFTDFEIKDALTKSCLYDELLSYGNLKDINVEQNGINFSESQLQRIEIARVLLNKPRIIVLDEISSALSEDLFYKIINNILRQGSGVLVITNNINNLKNMDKIYVLDQGSILDQGTYSYLLENCEHFKCLSNSNN